MEGEDLVGRGDESVGCRVTFASTFREGRLLGFAKQQEDKLHESISVLRKRTSGKVAQGNGNLRVSPLSLPSTLRTQ